MLEHLLELRFKGERKYIQGPDIFSTTLSWLDTQRSAVQEIDFAFHRLAKRQLKAVIGDLPENAEPTAVCTFTAAGVRERIYIVEIDEDVKESYPYPEEEIVSSMVIDIANRKAVLEGSVAYSDIEVWVAMSKALHQQVFPELQGKWLFVRGKFKQFTLQSASQDRALVIAASFNGKLTRSDAFIDGVKVGEIYFSIV
jgi:hypothetical protein